MPSCPHCHATRYQVKAGFNRSGSQRYRCTPCGRKYTPDPQPQGYVDAVRQQAVRLYVDGLNLRRIARLLQVNHQSVANWVKSYVDQLPNAPQPADPPDVLEMDELFTFVGSKKKKSTS